jgi:hypothetical protein
VLTALRYLVQHNPLYRDVTVDHSAMHHWPDEFIPSEIQQQVICLSGTDHHERAGYSVNLHEENYENDWQAAGDSHDDPNGDSPLVTASVTTDLNGDRQNPDLRLLNTISSLINDPQPQYTGTSHATHAARLATAQQRAPVIEYSVRGQVSLLNHWQDPHYLISAFPTLFPAGIGGHLDHRAMAVSLAAFADWALRHHSRSRVFLYLAVGNIG